MFEKSNAPLLAGYKEARPVVWASVFPESQDDFTILRQALDRLKLSDSSLSYEEEASGVLGRGFRCGFLGMLHLEIITERLRREFNVQLVITSPSIAYEITHDITGEVEHIYAASRFPDHGDKVTIREPWVLAQIIMPRADDANCRRSECRVGRDLWWRCRGSESPTTFGGIGIGFGVPALQAPLFAGRRIFGCKPAARGDFDLNFAGEILAGQRGRIGDDFIHLEFRRHGRHARQPLPDDPDRGL